MRTGHRCQRCGARAQLIVHHTDGEAAGANAHRLSNLEVAPPMPHRAPSTGVVACGVPGVGVATRARLILRACPTYGRLCATCWVSAFRPIPASDQTLSQNAPMTTPAVPQIAGFGYAINDPRVTPLGPFDGTDALYGFDIVIWDVARTLEFTGSYVDEDVLRRRRQELEHHLGRGNPLVIMLPSPRTRHVSGGGESFELPQGALPFELSLVAAKGSQVEVAGDSAANARLWGWAYRVVKYESYMPTPPGEPLLRIRDTTHVVASAFRHNDAVVLLLPRIRADLAYEGQSTSGRSAAGDLIDRLLELIATYRAETQLPAWSERYQLPGESDVLAAIEKRIRQQERLRRQIEQMRQQLAAIRGRKALITAQGPALEAAVDSALTALGFDLEPGPAGRTDRVIRDGEGVAVVEVKGKTKSAAERDAAQLEKWVSHHRADAGEQAKGILVVNGWLAKPLDQRPSVFPDQMMKYARDERQHCLVTGLQLLNLWAEAERSPDQCPELRGALLTTVGPLKGFDDPLSAFSTIVESRA
jgi:hypothetical protein